MLHRPGLHDAAALADRLRDARVVTTALFQELIGHACEHFPTLGRRTKSARIERLIQAEAWVDAALALIDLELPHRRVRRIAYDGGEWHCALSREPELADWLDESIEARHADLALAILSVFFEAQSLARHSGRPSVPGVPCGSPSIAMCCENFA